MAALKADPDLKDVSVVFLTSRASMQDVVAGLRSGAHDYLKKPFVPPELLARVASAAHVKHLQDTLRRRNAELDRMSRTDVLTGLYNRRHLDEELLRRIKDALRYHALVVAERVRSATAAAPVVVAGDDISFTVSGGLALGPGASTAELVHLADTCLYQAKAGGRNQIISATLASSSP